MHSAVTASKIESHFVRIPIIGDIYRVIRSMIIQQRNHLRRRRSSYRLAVYFRLQLFISLIGLSVFSFFPLGMRASFGDRVNQSCSDSSGDDLINNHQFIDSEKFWLRARRDRAAFQCGEVTGAGSGSEVDAGCDIEKIDILITFMWINSIIFFIALVVCFFMSCGFSVFSNLPPKSLDLENVTGRVSFLGGMCKHGPSIIRMLSATSTLMIFTLFMIVGVGKTCFGDITRTHNCVEFTDSCTYNQLLNCRYYFSSNCVGENLPRTSPEIDLLRSCSSSEFRKKFSGRFDVRVVYPSNCQRCWILHHDCRDIDVSHVRVLRNETSYDYVLLPLKSLSDENETKNLRTSPFFGASLKNKDMWQDIYCRCFDGFNNATATHRAMNRVRDLDMKKVEQINKEKVIDCKSIKETTCDPKLMSFISAVPDSIDNDFDDVGPWKNYRIVDSKKFETYQYCSWGDPINIELFYDESECTQRGSFISRRTYLTCAIMLLLAVTVTGVGSFVRLSVPYETWCYNPHPNDEGYLWKFLRFFGPG